MQDNVKKVIESQNDIENLSKKAEQMRTNAHDFNKNSTELKTIMYQRNLKLKIIMGTMVLGVVGYVLSGVL